MSLLLTSVPLFDKNMAVEAYLLRYLANKSDYIDGYSPVLEVLRKVTPDTFSADKPLFVPVGAQVLLDEDFDFPAGKIVFLMEEDVGADAVYLSAISRLSAAGFRVAVQDDQPESLLRLAKYSLHNLEQTQRKDPIAFQRNRARQYPGLVPVATHIPSLEAYQRAMREEYTLFEGQFYSEPVTKGSHDIAPLKVNLIRLLNVVRDDNFEFDVVARIVQNDPALSISLMRFINSPYIGVRRRIKTIKHAVIILGQKEVRKWVTAAVFKSLGSDRPGELVRISLLRAKLAEYLAGLFGMPGESQSLFLMGLFSVIDSILNVDMSKAMTMAPVSEDIQNALVSCEGRYAPVLEFMRLYERADWDAALGFCDRFRLSLDDVYRAYIDTLSWYNGLISEKVRPVRRG